MDKLTFCPDINNLCYGEECRDWNPEEKDCYRRTDRNLYRKSLTAHITQAQDYHELVHNIATADDKEHEEET